LLSRADWCLKKASWAASICQTTSRLSDLGISMSCLDTESAGFAYSATSEAGAKLELAWRALKEARPTPAEREVYAGGIHAARFRAAE
jgi:hypothetical protein